MLMILSLKHTKRICNALTSDLIDDIIKKQLTPCNKEIRDFDKQIHMNY